MDWPIRLSFERPDAIGLSLLSARIDTMRYRSLVGLHLANGDRYLIPDNGALGGRVMSFDELDFVGKGNGDEDLLHGPAGSALPKRSR
jgi:hypothetical protein